MKFQTRITNNGPIGGFTAEIFDNGKWRRVNQYIGGGPVSFDNREQAIRALRQEATQIARISRLVREAA